jgi:Protein of unknown function (DUF4236)
MGFRFRRSIRILPGLRLNFGKRGVSTSIGVRGAHVTVGHGQVRETVGLPGTGLSYTHVEGTHKTAADASGEAQPQPVPDVLPKGADRPRQKQTPDRATETETHCYSRFAAAMACFIPRRLSNALPKLGISISRIDDAPRTADAVMIAFAPNTWTMEMWIKLGQ